MDNNALNHYELQQAVISWVGNVMEQNKIPAYMMEDALNYALGRVKELVFQDYIQALRAAEEQQEPQQTDTTTEKEVSDQDMAQILQQFANMSANSGGQVNAAAAVPEVPEVGKQALENAKKRNADK